MALHTLHIGLNYRGTSSELAGCLNDARDWQKRCAPYAASTLLLLEQKATRAGILEAGKELFSRLKPGDTAWITFSGHGTVDTDQSGDEWTGYDQALVCYPERRQKFGLIFDDEIGGLAAARPLLFGFLDCCHSKSMMRGGARPRFVPISRCQRHKRVAGPGTIRTLPDCGTFSGCGEKPSDYSFDGSFDGRPNGAATFYGLRALDEFTGGASYRRWFTRLRRYLPSDEYPQTPHCYMSARNQSRPVPILEAA